ncbi:MAG: transcription antitermination factor NusB [Tenericutes bacterium]|nr:transcription antitermination factor NusB [Mycoplasmatota bacterium]
MNRSEARGIIMTILYQVFMYEKSNIDYDLNEVFSENLKIDNSFVKEMVTGVLDKKNDIDNIANKYLKDWDIKRLSLPDQAILRMGIYELLYTDTPDIVAINEAVELSKKYSDDKVKNMINGVLDKVYHSK